MKLVRVGSAGEEHPGIVDSEGRVRDLSGIVTDIDLAEPGLLDRIRGVDLEVLPIVATDVRCGPPVARTSKFIAIGLNYTDHAIESGMPIPSEPVVFSKATSCIAGANDAVMLPRGSVKTDWEVELGIVIGKRARYVSEAEALDHVAGYLVVDDISEREYQNERGGTWDKGKGCDTFGPIGPWLVTTDEVGDPQALSMWLDVNGEPMQRGSTATMIFPCAKLVSYVSEFLTLLPGDIITTGTPPGVGMGKSPPTYLKAGDILTLGIEKLGVQRQEIKPFAH